MLAYLRLDCSPASVDHRLVSAGTCRERESLATCLFCILDEGSYRCLIFKTYTIVTTHAEGSCELLWIDFYYITPEEHRHVEEYPVLAQNSTPRGVISGTERN
jgi:hypothetical protein